MHMIRLPVAPNRSAQGSTSLEFYLGEHIHNHFFLETEVSTNKEVSTLKDFRGRSKTVPLRLEEIMFPGVRFLGIREAKHYRKCPTDMLYEWTVNSIGLNMPIYFLGDRYNDRGGREYGSSLTQTYLGWKRGFVPLDVLVGGLGVFPIVPMYK